MDELTRAIQGVPQPSTFAAGARCVFRGLRLYYSQRRYWRYGLLPMVFVAILYAIWIGALWWWLGPTLAGFLPDPEGAANSFFATLWTVLQTMVFWSVLLVGILLMLLVVSMVYEAVGGLFFDELVIRVEQDLYGRTAPALSLKENIYATLRGLRLALGTLLISLILFLPGWLIPVVGPALLAVILGYRLALSYLLSPASTRNWTLRQVRRKAARKRWAVLGFGIVGYALLLIPFSAIFVLPPLSVGGAMLFNEVVEPE